MAGFRPENTAGEVLIHRSVIHLPQEVSHKTR